MLRVLNQLFARLLDRFHLYVLERSFQSMETSEAKAMRLMIEDIEALKAPTNTFKEKT